MNNSNENADVYQSLQRKTKHHRKHDRKRLRKAAKKMYEAVRQFEERLVESEFQPEWMSVKDFSNLRESLRPYEQSLKIANEDYVADRWPRNNNGNIVVENITLVDEYLV